MWSTLNFWSNVKWGKRLDKVVYAAQELTRFEEFIANDREVRRQAVAYRKHATDTVRGARAHAAKVKVTRVDREAMSAE
jgi:hypothetical protein